MATLDQFVTDAQTFARFADDLSDWLDQNSTDHPDGRPYAEAAFRLVNATKKAARETEAHAMGKRRDKVEESLQKVRQHYHVAAYYVICLMRLDGRISGDMMRGLL